MGKIKRVVGADEPTVGVEIIPKPIVVQIPTLAIPVEIPHVAVAIRAQPDKNVKCHLHHCLLNILNS